MTAGKPALKRASEEEWKRVTRLNYAAWGKGISLDDYCDREERVLGQTEFARRRRVPWTLQDANGELLSSCETYERDIWYSPGDGIVKKGIAHSVASVFTPGPHRGRGHASDMMQQLGAWCAAENVLASNLYSDVGPEFYARLGWSPSASIDHAVAVSPAAAACATFATNAESTGLARLFPVDGLDAVVERDCERMRKLLEGAGSVTAALPLSKDAVEWMRTRSLFYHERMLGRPANTFSPFVGMETSSGDCYALWAPNFKEGCLEVLRMSAATCTTNPTDWAYIVAFSVREAQRCGLERVVFWTRPELAGGPLASVNAHLTSTAREGSIPSLAWFPDPSASVSWICSEKYAWV